MIQTWTPAIIVALLTFATTTSSAVARTSRHGAKSSPVLRGGRRRRTDELLYCSSIGCPASYTPIDNAWTVECEGASCEVDQCCEALCAGFACPDSLVPIEEVKYDVCVDNVCTAAQCCEGVNDANGDEEDNDEGEDDDVYDYCSSISCPSDTHRLIDDADSTVCKVIGETIISDPVFPEIIYDDGSYSYDYNDDDDVAGGSFSFAYNDDDLFTSDSFADDDSEYCDIASCCVEMEYGLFGLE